MQLKLALGALMLVTSCFYDVNKIYKIKNIEDLVGYSLSHVETCHYSPALAQDGLRISIYAHNGGENLLRKQGLRGVKGVFNKYSNLSFENEKCHEYIKKNKKLYYYFPFENDSGSSIYIYYFDKNHFYVINLYD